MADAETPVTGSGLRRRRGDDLEVGSWPRRCGCGQRARGPRWPSLHSPGDNAACLRSHMGQWVLEEVFWEVGLPHAWGPGSDVTWDSRSDLMFQKARPDGTQGG